MQKCVLALLLLAAVANAQLREFCGPQKSRVKCLHAGENGPELTVCAGKMSDGGEACADDFRYCNQTLLIWVCFS